MFEGFKQQFQCLASVAEMVLFITAELGGSLLVTTGNEYGIITMAIVALGFKTYFPFPGGLADDGSRILGMTHIHKYTLETGSSGGRRCLYGAKQLVVVAFGRGVGATVTGGVDAGSAVQSINFEA